ncbi:MAG: hypothetical protein ACE5M4_14205, partial [Anaerolineales bacterium]
FRRFYEDLLIMTGEGVPVEVTVRKIETAFPVKEEQQAILGHLRDTLKVYLAGSNWSDDDDKESAEFVPQELRRANQLEKLIEALKKRLEE